MANKPILEQLDSGFFEKRAKILADFYADNPDYGSNPRPTEKAGGKTIYRTFANSEGTLDRYWYDCTGCRRDDGWKQYDTDQDAFYFGVWYHMERQIVVTYAEGDETVVVCHTPEAWATQLKEMADFYGDPPPAFKSLSIENGQLIETHYIDEDARPAYPFTDNPDDHTIDAAMAEAASEVL